MYKIRSSIISAYIYVEYLFEETVHRIFDIIFLYYSRSLL